jgi:DnaK suppressor protein
MKKAKSVKASKKPTKKVAKVKASKKSKPSKAAKSSKKPKPVKAKKAVVKKAKPVKSKAPKAIKKAIKKLVKNPVKNSKAVHTKKEKSHQIKPVIQKKVEKRMKENSKKTINDKTPERARYKESELKEFKDLLLHKLDDARKELTNLQSAILNANEHGTDDTASTFKVLEDGSDTLAKEEASQLAQRQRKFIEQLENALMRIENKTYGICRVTGKLIPKERLRAVPHTTQSMEAKLQQYND